MRTSKDRLRHTILFEILLVATAGPLLSLLLDQPMHTMGTMTLLLSFIAMTVNYLYNWAFDHTLNQLGKPVHERSPVLRILHAILFELCLVAFTIPIVMQFLGYTLTEALILDIGFIVFVPLYAFAFNMIYDHIFPMPSSENEDSTLP